MADETDKEELSGRSKGIFLLIVCILLSWWRGAGFVEDLQLFFNTGETVIAVEESRETVARNARYHFYFLAEGDTIRNESDMFGFLMSMTNSTNDDGRHTFKVVYNTSDPNINYPRASLRVHFFISLITLLLALALLTSAIGHFRRKT